MSWDVITELSPKKKEAFDELKKLISDDYGPQEADDLRIYRFLKARNFDVRAAEKMLRNNIDWRKREKVDNIIQDYKIPEVLEKYAPIYVLGLDLEGSPILVLELGNVDIKGLLKCATKEECMRHVAYYLEICAQCSTEQTQKFRKPMETWTVILDFANLHLSQFTTRTAFDYMRYVLANYECNYPERLKVSNLINASIYYNFIYILTKPVLAAETVRKFKVFGKNGWQEHLRQTIDPSILPDYLAGDNTNEELSITKVTHGGIVPESYYRRVTKIRLSLCPGIMRLNLRRSGQADIPTEVKVPQSILEWQFQTKDFDVGIGLAYKRKGDLREQRQWLIPIRTVDSHIQVQSETFICQEAGIYILTFDNSHSWLRKKEIFYKVSLTKP